MAKEEPVGPRGRNRGTSRSELKIEDPSAACVATISRGFESVEGMPLAVLLVELLDDILGGC